MFPKNKLKKVKRVSIKSLDAKLWKIFSEFIRRRDSGTNGFFNCITCGKPRMWKKADAGHFINRRHLAVKFDPKNVNGQCKPCNGFDEGNKHLYAPALDKKWGKDTAAQLEASKRSQVLGGRVWYEAMIENYKNKLKELKEKGYGGPF